MKRVASSELHTQGVLIRVRVRPSELHTQGFLIRTIDLGVQSILIL